MTRFVECRHRHLKGRGEVEKRKGAEGMGEEEEHGDERAEEVEAEEEAPSVVSVGEDSARVGEEGVGEEAEGHEDGLDSAWMAMDGVLCGVLVFRRWEEQQEIVAWQGVKWFER